MGKRYPDRSRDPAASLHAAVVTAELDLHGLSLREAEIRVEGFLRARRVTHAGQVVRIVTGRGNRSEGRAVLKERVLELLREDPQDLVADLAVDRGGGAVLVRLRPS